MWTQARARNHAAICCSIARLPDIILRMVVSPRCNSNARSRFDQRSARRQVSNSAGDIRYKLLDGLIGEAAGVGALPFGTWHFPHHQVGGQWANLVPLLA